MTEKTELIEKIVTNLLIEMDKLSRAENLTSIQQNQVRNAANCAESILNLVLEE